MSDVLAVLTDAILWQDGTLPDELCPLYLVDAGRRLGGDAAAVAELALEEHREEWFVVGDLRFEPEALYKQLTRGRMSKKRRALRRVEVVSALRWHVQSLRQLVEAWGHKCARPFSRNVITEVRVGAGTFQIDLMSKAARWVQWPWPFGEAGTYTRVPVYGTDSLSSVPGWVRWRSRSVLARPLTETQSSRKARDAALASRQAEMVMGGGVG